MKKIYALTLAVFLGCLQLMAGAAEPLSGQALFAANCAGCHGKDGGGDVGPNLNSQRSADLLKKLQGYQDGVYGGSRKATMENVAGRHSREELEAIADYIGQP